jgi:hypothetical protein
VLLRTTGKPAGSYSGRPVSCYSTLLASVGMSLQLAQGRDCKLCLQRPAGKRLTSRVEPGDHVVAGFGCIHTKAKHLLAIAEDWRRRCTVLHIFGFMPQRLVDKGYLGTVLVFALRILAD